MISFNDLSGIQHQISVNDVKSVKAEFDEHTGIGVFLKMNTDSIILVKSNYFSPSSRFDYVITVDSPVYVLKRILDLKISKLSKQ